MFNALVPKSESARFFVGCFVMFSAIGLAVTCTNTIVDAIVDAV